MPNPTFIPLMSSFFFFFDLGFIIFISHYSNFPVLIPWRHSIVIRAPLTLRYTDNKGKAYNILGQNFYSLLCGYCLSFTPSPLAATLFLMSHCGLQLHGSYF